MHKLKLYGTPLSGHVHRVALLLSMLELPYEFIESPAEVRQSEAFRRLNPLGQIPVLVDGDLTLADSNAILVYLAKKLRAGQPLAAGDATGGGAGAGVVVQSGRRSTLRSGVLPPDRPIFRTGGR
ncbi:Dichloromethane dehalogenase [Serratia liquefaciens]|nr:Dichloromethane dehalogenase [Serratia liquefaciens]